MAKQKISKELFNRKIKIWGLWFPLIGVFVSVAFSVLVAFIDKPKVEYSIPKEDQIIINKLAHQINELIKQYISTSDRKKKDKINIELSGLAKEEEIMMSKYNPNYQSRWPSKTMIAFIEKPKHELITGFTAFIMLISLHYLAINRIKDKYEVD